MRRFRRLGSGGNSVWGLSLLVAVLSQFLLSFTRIAENNCILDRGIRPSTAMLSLSPWTQQSRYGCWKNLARSIEVDYC